MDSKFITQTPKLIYRFFESVRTGWETVEKTKKAKQKQKTIAKNFPVNDCKNLLFLLLVYCYP